MAEGTKQTALLRLLRSRIDLRTDWGRQAWTTIQKYAERGATAKLSLLKSLVTYFEGRPLVDVLNVEPVDYRTDVKDRCACGRELSKELYRMRVKGHVRKGAVETEILQKIKDKKPFKKSISEFILGSECYDHLPDLLSDFGFDELKRRTKIARRKGKKELEEILNAEFSDELKNRLSQVGINPEDLAKLGSLVKELSFDNSTEAALLYDLDPGKRNSLACWFDEGIKNKTITDPEIIEIYNKAIKVPHLLKQGDLGLLMTYQYDFRKHNTDAVIGGVKKDLFYLASLPLDHNIIKKFRKINLDKRYVRPATKFISREGLEEKTVREKLNESHLTFVEALGIYNHFKNIEDIRYQCNKDTAQKYGVGRTWDYLLEKIIPVFIETKKKFAEDFKKFGEVVRESVLTRDDYRTIKAFLKRSEIGTGSARENYLKRFSIGSFKEVAPKIVAVGRKIKIAEGLYENGAKDYSTLKKEFLLKEDLEKDLEKKTGIIEPLEAVIDFIANSYSEDKLYNNFKIKYGKTIENFFKEGLIESKDIEKIKRWYSFLKKEGVAAIPKEASECIEKIKELEKIGILKSGEEFKDLINSRYVNNAAISQIIKVSSESDKFEKEINKAPYKKEIKQIIETLKNTAIINYDNNLVDVERLQEPRGIYRTDVSFYDLEEVSKLAELIKKTEAVSENWIEKFNSLIDKRIAPRVGLDLDTFFDYHYEKSESKKFRARKNLIDKVENIYANNQDLIKKYRKIDEQRTEIAKQLDVSKRIRDCWSFLKDYELLNKVIEKYPSIKKVINQDKFKQENIIYSSLKAWEDGESFDPKNTEIISSFNPDKAYSPRVLEEKNIDISYAIRQDRKIKDEKKEWNRLFFKVYEEIKKDKEIMAVAKGLGATDYYGKRILGKDGKGIYYSPAREEDKWTVRNFTEGLKEAVLGQTKAYAISNRMKERFEEDVKQGRIEKQDIKKFTEAMYRFESIVNNALVSEYSIENLDERKRREKR